MVGVHQIIIQGNSKTKDSVFLPEVSALRKATTVEELLQAASIVKDHLQSLEIFDDVNITIDLDGAGELLNAANVIITVAETRNPRRVSFGLAKNEVAKNEVGSWVPAGSLKWRNVFGYGDIWDGKWGYGWDETPQVTAGVSRLRFKGLPTALSMKITLLSQDWLGRSSFKERSLGVSLGLISTKHHELAYNLAWATLTDTSQMSSKSVRMQLGHTLFSSLSYKFMYDTRDSLMRPTRGHACSFSTKIFGLAPDSWSLRFIRQEFEVRYALPLGICNAAVNLGIFVGANLPWGSGFTNMPSPISKRFFIGGQYSSLHTLGGPTRLWGFKSWGVGPTEPKRQNADKGNTRCSAVSGGRDTLGGDLAITAFAELSFDLPWKVLGKVGIYGHTFASIGNLSNITDNKFCNFSVQQFVGSFRSSVGFGIKSSFYPMELNYCYILKQNEHDHAKAGFQFSFS